MTNTLVIAALLLTMWEISLSREIPETATLSRIGEGRSSWFEGSLGSS